MNKTIWLTLLLMLCAGLSFGQTTFNPFTNELDFKGTGGGGSSLGTNLTSTSNDITSDNGSVIFQGTGGTNNEDLKINLESSANRATFSSSTGAEVFFNDRVEFISGLEVRDNEHLALGDGADSIFKYNYGGNDNLQLGMTVGAASGAGVFAVMEKADMTDVDRQVGTVTDPTLRVYSSDATQADDYIDIYHDGTNAVFDVGNGAYTFPGGNIAKGSNTWGEKSAFTWTFDQGDTVTDPNIYFDGVNGPTFNYSIGWDGSYRKAWLINSTGASSSYMGGLYSITTNNRSSSNGGVIGIDNRTITANSSSAVTTSYGILNSDHTKTGSGTLTNFYGIYSDDGEATSGTITNNWAGYFTGALYAEGNAGIDDTSPDATFEIAETGTTPFMISDGESGDGDHFIVDSTGNVGIGTTEPQKKLDINGDFIVDTSSVANTQATFTLKGTGNTNATSFQFSDPDTNNLWQMLSRSNDSNNLYFENYDGSSFNRPLQVDFGGDVWMGSSTSARPTTLVAKSGGNVGVADDSPDAKLEVVEDGTTPFMISNGASGDGDFFIVDSTGKVGIGTTSPSYKLEIGGDIGKNNVELNPYMGVYVSTPALTTISVAGTYVKMAGTTTETSSSASMDDASSTSNRIRYTGSDPRHFHIVAQATVELSAGTNQHIGIQIWHYDDSGASGSLLAHSEAVTTISGNDETQITTHGDVMLDTNDYLELHLVNETNANDITANNAYLFAMGMP